MKSLRKRKIAKAMGVKATYTKYKNGTKSLLLEGRLDGFYILDKDETMSNSQFLQALKKVE